MNYRHASLALLASGCSLAFAQTAPAPVVKVAPVVVQEAPLSADAAGTTTVRVDPTIPASSLGLEALTERVANLHLNAGGAAGFGDILTLRGLSNTPYFSDPSVTLYFDDLPLGNTFSYPTGLFGFGTAHILRGPQGTAFGRGGEAGTISLQSAEPGAVAAGEVRVGFGDYNARFGAIEARSARGEKADLSVAAAGAERDGYIDNTTLGRTVDDQETYSASARLRLRPTATSEFTLQLLGNRHLDGSQPLVPLGGPLFTVTRAREGSTRSEFGGAALKAAFDTSFGRLSSTTSATTWKLDPYDNRLELPPTLDSRLTQAQRAWNEELRLASAPKSLVAWHAGAWFSDTRTHGDADRAVVLPFGTVPAEVSHFALTSRISALFGEIVVPPNIGWTITAGLRLEETKKDFDRSQQVPGPGRFTDHETFDLALPKVSASYALTNDTNFTATIALGAKPGGWSGYTANAALAPFKRERTLAFEAGVDTALAEKTLLLAARVFDYEIRDYQIERSFNAQDYLVVNAPRARSIGGEAEATWRATPELTFTATLGLTDVTLRAFTDPFTGASYAGNRAPYAPDYDAHVSATYRAKSGYFATAEAASIGKTFFDESENPAFVSDAHTLVNARIGYETTRWRVSLYGENLGDKGYYAMIVPGVGHAASGAPRTWGVEAAVKW